MKNLCSYISSDTRPPFQFFYFSIELKELIKKLDIITVYPNEFLLNNFYMNEEYESLEIKDFFGIIEINDNEIKRLQENNNCIILFDWSVEGYSNEQTNMFEILTYSAIKHKIPGEKIFILTGNLFEEKNYDIWQKEHSPNFKMNVFSFLLFEATTPYCTSYDKLPTIDDTIKSIKDSSRIDYKNFLCLNQAKRDFRNLVCYKIYHSNAFPDFYISYNKMDDFNFLEYFFELWNKEDSTITKKKIKNFIKSSPSILDQKDFSIQWAIKGPPKDLYNKTMCSIVNETLHDSYNGNCLFYTEKTFKPMLYNHPLMIIGQSNTNKSLKNYGYKTYEDYFDLSFDNIENHYQRLTEQIAQIEELNKKLNRMSAQERCKWYLNGVETIYHNKTKIFESVNFNTSLRNLMKKLKELLD